MSYLVAMPRTLTLAELSEAIAEGTRASLDGSQDVKTELRDTLMRRIRHWTVAGVLPTLNEPHAGTGRRRHYAEETAYLVVILNRLADWGLPIGVLKAAAEVILQDKRQLRGWREAVAGGRQVYLYINPYAPAEDPGADELVLSAHSGADIAAALKRRSAGMCLNLTVLFAGVAL